MSEDSEGSDGFSRRTFLQASGAAASAALLGVPTAAGHDGFHSEFANVRVREAMKAWDRGVRGRPNRTIGATDTGIEARHPDLGPWNGIHVDFKQDKKEMSLVEDFTSSDSHPWTNPHLENVHGGAQDPFANVPSDPDKVTPDTPKVLGWYDATTSYGNFGKKPRDEHGHGTHVSSIMGGSGRASAIDPATVTSEEPRAILAAGDFLSYEVEADAGTGVYGSAYGKFIGVTIQGPDGQTLDRSTFQPGDVTAHDDSSYDGSNVVAETPTVHESGTATYTVYVRPMSGEAAAVAQVERVSAGAFADPQSTVGDRTESGAPSLHSGIAPNQGLVMFAGLSAPTADLGENADWFRETFNLRSINMSWGSIGGLPFGMFGGALDRTVSDVRKMAEGGILTVAAAGNSSTPANGNSSPAVADEAISVAATDPRDGLVSYSSGGIGGADEDQHDFDRKPDVTAPGGSTTDLVNAADNGHPDKSEDEQPPIRDYTELAGTSMASPYTNGIAGLVFEAMEFDAPESIAIASPDTPEDELEGTWKDEIMRVKQAILATATETAFTAAPYHDAHFPTYDFGGRDPYEGFGRVNPDAAIDAVTRDLTPGDSATTLEAELGLNVPEDSRAIAGYVTGDPGVYEVSVDYSHLSGGNKGMAKGDPHIDLFVYDAENPDENGAPNIVARSMGREGSTSLQFTASQKADDGSTESGTYYVVAKLVNVPGVVNGFDVQAHFDLSVEQVQDLIVTGSRTDDGSVFTGGQTDRIEIDVSADEPVVVRDRVPNEWTVLEEFSDDVARVLPDSENPGYKLVYFEPVPDSDETSANEDDKLTSEDLAASPSVNYLVEAPEGLDETGSYEFGPVEVSTDVDPSDDPSDWVSVAGTGDTNRVVGQSTNL